MNCLKWSEIIGVGRASGIEVWSTWSRVPLIFDVFDELVESAPLKSKVITSASFKKLRHTIEVNRHSEAVGTVVWGVLISDALGWVLKLKDDSWSIGSPRVIFLKEVHHVDYLSIVSRVNHVLQIFGSFTDWISDILLSKGLVNFRFHELERFAEHSWHHKVAGIFWVVIGEPDFLELVI